MAHFLQLIDHSYTMLLAGGTPLNNPLIDFCPLLSKSRLHFQPHVTIFWQFSFNFMKATFIKSNQKSIFQNFISQNLELRTVKQRHPYFHPSRTPPHLFRPRTNCRGLFPNHIKNHHFVICRALTSYLSLNLIAISQGTSILFAVLVYFLRNYLGLHQTRTHLVVCCVDTFEYLTVYCSEKRVVF